MEVEKSNRRLIGGILMILTGALFVVVSIRIIGKYSATGIVGGAFWELLFSLFTLGYGVFAVATYKKRPTKAIEFALLIIGVVLYFMCRIVAPVAYEGVANAAFIELVLFAITLPYKGGYKNLPYKGTEFKAVQQQVTQSKENFVGNADELAKYKKLLDDKAISQEEYDKVKSRILGEK